MNSEEEMFCRNFLREYVPLKQGLRRDEQCFIHHPIHSPRVCSTKTRIKTIVFAYGNYFLMPLREYVPLKQGLRHPQFHFC